MKVELFLIPISAFFDKLHFYVVKSPSRDFAFPSSIITDESGIDDSTHSLLRSHLSFTKASPTDEQELFNIWLSSPRFNSRIVNVYDRESLYQKEKSIAIVRVVPIPESFSFKTKDSWQESHHLLHADSRLSQDNKFFLKECLNLMPVWVKNTSFTFELMSRVFSIQELRMLVGILSEQEIDPGNFHRRLKKLDILRPLGVGQQRVHKWEFAWERSMALAADGLIP